MIPIIVFLGAIVGAIKLHRDKKRRRRCSSLSDSPSTAPYAPRQQRGCYGNRRRRLQNRRTCRKKKFWDEPVVVEKGQCDTVGEGFGVKAVKDGEWLPPPYENLEGRLPVVGEDRLLSYGESGEKNMREEAWVNVERLDVPMRSSRRV